MNPSDNIERAVEQLNVATRSQTDQHILNDAFAALEQAVRKQSTPAQFAARRRTVVVRVAELAAVAAVIILFVALFFGTSPADVKFADICQALAAVENICITTFEPPENTPVQIEWVSRALNIDMFRIAEQFVLVDTENEAKITKNAAEDSVRTQRASQEMLTRIKRSASAGYGLVPFSDISGVTGAMWSGVDDSQLSPEMADTGIYELTWPEQDEASDSAKLRKWRIYLDKNTKLPRRAEWYSKLPSQDDFKLESYSVVTYPTETQLQRLVRDTFGRAATQPRQPEYIGTPQPN
jgi:hypothetical protein